MGNGHELGGKYREDPINSHKDAGRSRGLEAKKHSRDGASWTPTESRIRDGLMKQFCKLGEGSSGNSAEYCANYDLIDWSK